MALINRKWLLNTQLHTARYIILNILACNCLASELEVQLLSSSADLISWQRLMLIAKEIAIQLQLANFAMLPCNSLQLQLPYQVINYPINYNIIRFPITHQWLNQSVLLRLSPCIHDDEYYSAHSNYFHDVWWETTVFPGGHTMNVTNICFCAANIVWLEWFWSRRRAQVPSFRQKMFGSAQSRAPHGWRRVTHVILPKDENLLSSAKQDVMSLIRRVRSLISPPLAITLKPRMRMVVCVSCTQKWCREIRFLTAICIAAFYVQ